MATSFERDAVVVNQGQESAKYPYENCGWLYETAGNFYYLLVTGQGFSVDDVVRVAESVRLR